jgi:hypothetical protein
MNKLHTIVRKLVSAGSCPAPLDVQPGNRGPASTGSGGYWTTPSGAVCHYPAAYRRAFGRPTYHRSTRAITVGQEWLDAAQSLPLSGVDPKSVQRELGRRAARARVIRSVRVIPRLDLARCLVCSQRVQGVPPHGLAPIHASDCEECGSWYHADCAAWVEHHCGRFGCEGVLSHVNTLVSPTELFRN